MNVRSGSKPQAMMSFALSNAKPWAWAIVSGLPSFWKRNFSSSATDGGGGAIERRGQRGPKPRRDRLRRPGHEGACAGVCQGYEVESSRT